MARDPLIRHMAMYTYIKVPLGLSSLSKAPMVDKKIRACKPLRWPVRANTKNLKSKHARRGHGGRDGPVNKTSEQQNTKYARRTRYALSTFGKRLFVACRNMLLVELYILRESPTTKAKGELLYTHIPLLSPLHFAVATISHCLT